MSSYLAVVYDEKERPYTDYPEKLCKYLYQGFGMKKGMLFLEAGCGRGEHLSHFKRLGLDVRGVDISNEACRYQPELCVAVADVENQGLPFEESSFDVVYSKSFIEHLYHPEIYVKEAYRVLKPGGLFLTLVPDWEANHKIYFDDYTHRTPFTRNSLEDIYKIFGFDQVKAKKFRQLPIVWRHPWLNCLCAVLSPFVPVRTKNRFLRWSRELMLVGSGRKPASGEVA
jgi:SAM-dependent methyltransferase